MEQLIRELILIGIVLAVTMIAYLFIRRSGGTASENAERVLTGVLGAFMLLGLPAIMTYRNLPEGAPFLEPW